MRFLTNIHRENKENQTVPFFGDTPKEAEASWQEWLRDKIIGDPQPGPNHTVDQLKRLGMVGVYESEPSKGDVMTSDEIADYAAAEFVKYCDRRKED